MRTLVFDPFSGASGNMILGALIDAGADMGSLVSMLSGLDLPVQWDVRAERVSRGSLTGLLVDVSAEETSVERHLSDIRSMIESAELPAEVKSGSLAAFGRLAEAESAAHGIPVSSVHFHETGAVDAIIDIVGSFCALHLIGADQVFASPVATGTGTVSCAHGTLPLPAPATLHLLKGIPTVPTGIRAELTTPTGAAILTTAVSCWNGLPPPSMPVATGMGAGSAELERPNLLRVTIYETADTGLTTWDHDTSMQLVTVMDDIDLRTWPEVSSSLLEAGAYDCYAAVCIGRKGRPALEVTVLCPPHVRNRVLDRMFRETPTLGVRTVELPRAVLRRRFLEVNTDYGTISVKVGFMGDEPVNIEPEYADCRSRGDALSVEPAMIASAARVAAAAMLSGGDPGE